MRRFEEHNSTIAHDDFFTRFSWAASARMRIERAFNKQAPVILLTPTKQGFSCCVKTYTVELSCMNGFSCTCLDHVESGHRCKHIYRVLIIALGLKSAPRFDSRLTAPLYSIRMVVDLSDLAVGMPRFQEPAQGLNAEYSPYFPNPSLKQ